MPQLTSGRHVGLSTDRLFRMIDNGSDEARSVAMVWLRLHVNTPEKLRNELAIVLYREGEGTPPAAPAYLAGYTVGDVLDGRTDWPPQDVADLQAFLATRRAKDHVQTEFEQLSEAIRQSPVWDSPLWTDD